jgi:pyruvate dehydrogenase E1 component alpha subunit
MPGAAAILGLYRAMVRIRVCEESFVEPILAREILCPVHLCTGQEAVAAGVCAALSREDYVFGNHRSHGHFLAKGGGMKEMVAEVYCRETGCSRGRGGSMHLVDPSVGMMGSAPIVAGTVSLALGAALASKIRGNGRVAVSFFGDGATGEGVLCESLNFARWRSCRSCSSARTTSTPRTSHRRDPHQPQDLRAGDPVWRDEPAHRRERRPRGLRGRAESGGPVQEGEGPVFLECLTYRMRATSARTTTSRGRTPTSARRRGGEWRRKDPIRRMERHS